MSKNDTPILVIPTSEFEKRGSFRGYQPVTSPDGALIRDDVGYYLGMGDSNENAIARFMRRGDAEVDPNFKQLIPYAIVICGKTVLTYTRAKGGGEDRLHDKLSIGVGGHIDATDDTDPFWAYMKGLKRELLEEIGLDLDFNALKATLHGIVNDDLDGAGPGKVGVGQVHLGLVHLIVVNETMAAAILKNATKLEMDNPRFIPIREFGENKALREQLESWSGFVADKLVEDLGIAGPWTRPDIRERILFLAATASKVAAGASGLLLQEDSRGWLLSKENLEQVLGEFQAIFAGVAASEDINHQSVVHHGQTFRSLLPTCTKYQDFNAPDAGA